MKQWKAIDQGQIFSSKQTHQSNIVFDSGIIATICFSMNPSFKRSLAFLMTFVMCSRLVVLLFWSNILSSKFNLLFWSLIMELSKESLKSLSLGLLFFFLQLLFRSSVKVIVLGFFWCADWSGSWAINFDQILVTI